MNETTINIWKKNDFPLYQFPVLKKDVEKYSFSSLLNVNYDPSLFHANLSPLPDQNIINDFYGNIYQDFYTSIYTRFDKTQIMQLDYVQKILSHISKHFNNKKINICEIGGGDGHCLDALSDIANTRTLIEPNKFAVKHIRDQNISVHNRFLDDSFLENNQTKYDAVICRHVIEHIDDYGAFIKNLSLITSENGILILETPSLEKILSIGLVRVLSLQHFQYFSVYSLSNAVINNSPLRPLHIDFVGTDFILYFNKNEQNDFYSKYANILDSKKLLTQNANAFESLINNKNQEISSLVTKWKKDQNKKIFVWGAGSAAYDLFTTYNLDLELIDAFIDIDPNKKGKVFPSCPQIPILIKDSHIWEQLEGNAILITTYAIEEVEKDLKKNLKSFSVANIYAIEEKIVG